MKKNLILIKNIENKNENLNFKFIDTLFIKKVLKNFILNN